MDRSGKMKLSHININSTKSNETKHFEFMESRDIESFQKFSRLYNVNSSQINEVYSDQRCPFAGFNNDTKGFKTNKIEYHAHKI